MPSTRTLDYRFRPMADAFLAYVRAAYPQVRLTSARRTHAEQGRLYARAQAGLNSGLPAMPPGTSDHEYGLAMDLATPGVDPFADGVLPYLGDTWIRWGGRWNKVDPVHFAAPRDLARSERVRRPRKGLRLDPYSRAQLRHHHRRR